MTNWALRLRSVVIFASACAFAPVCAAQSVIPESPLITLQYNSADALPAAPVLFNVRNSGGPSAPPLLVTVKPSATTQNWLRVQRVGSQTSTSDSCPQDPGGYISFPSTLTLNTSTEKLCVTAARTISTPGNYAGYLTLTPPSGIPAQVIVNLNVLPASHLLLTADPAVAFNENILIVATNGAATSPQTIRVDVVDPANPGVRLNSPLAYSISANDFLTVTCLQQDRKTACGPNPTSPIFLQVSVTPTNTMGQLAANIAIASTNPGAPGNDVISVLANITGLMPSVAIDTTPLVFSAIAGAAATLPVQSIKVNGTLNFTASAVSDDGTGWLSVTPSIGTAPATLTVMAAPGINRAAGVFTGSIVITPTGGTPVRVPVSLRVAGLVATPSTAVAFACAPGESAKIAVASSDPSVAIPFTAAALNSPFLMIASSSATTPATVTLTTNCAGLDPKAYSAMVTLLPVGATAGPVIPVTLAVGPAAMFSVSPAALMFSYDLGKPDVLPATQTLSAVGTIPLSFTATATIDGSGNWLTVTPRSGATNSALTVSVNPAGLAAVTTPYTGRIVITYNSAQVVVPVSLLVTNVVASVISSSSAATGLTAVAPESIASAYGTNLAGTALTATDLPLPTSLGGVTVRVKDSSGTERLAPIFFVSPGQVNYLIPAGTAAGQATVTIGTASGTAAINSIAPGVFTANANGKGAPAATAAIYGADGAVTPEAVFQCSTGGAGSCTPVPISLGAGADQVFLTLYGTGIRGRSSVANVKCSVGGVILPVAFAGPQGAFVGLDQVNVALPQSLAGQGEVDLVLIVDGQSANPVRVIL